jgi:hypothetical protein
VSKADIIVPAMTFFAISAIVASATPAQQAYLKASNHRLAHEIVLPHIAHVTTVLFDAVVPFPLESG